MAGKITLIGLDQAVVGGTFRYVTPLQTCSECKIKNVCFNLEQGKTYRIKEVRMKEQPCNVFNTGKVTAVSVEELPEEFIMEYDRRVQEGSVTATRSMKCDYITCQYIEKCNLIHHRNDGKVKISSIGQKVECPKGYNMRKISGSYISEKK
ncbi:MAG: UPF0179 family protein [Candidatus Thermoplasmatota archaeon]|jgi:hypothetical protein|nr:UPF0179 family protein [Candidatus Thermoplasmatota archaeon]MCL5791173.1 UPF0179 family protein [Candidatus Thermoplasmatota archaeon]